MWTTCDEGTERLFVAATALLFGLEVAMVNVALVPVLSQLVGLG